MEEKFVKHEDKTALLILRNIFFFVFEEKIPSVFRF